MPWGDLLKNSNVYRILASRSTCQGPQIPGLKFAGRLLAPSHRTDVCVGSSRSGNHCGRWNQTEFPSHLVTKHSTLWGETLWANISFSPVLTPRYLTFSSFWFFFSFRFLVFHSSSLTSHAGNFSSGVFSYHPIPKSRFLFPARSFLCVHLSQSNNFGLHSLLTRSCFFSHVSQPWWSRP